MRMKEDHMRNGQLKPGYNVQIGTENQFIVGYSQHQRSTETRCLNPYFEKVKASLGKLFKTIIADAGYGGEESYAYLDSRCSESEGCPLKSSCTASKGNREIRVRLYKHRYEKNCEVRTGDRPKKHKRLG